ncbi:hypothetical protein [Aquimarina aggregata]|uniref:hypothetical protein n=1 Tax=Aquimarina aggregata TaxID=1642818 RepID=UPI00248FC99E|nr:hypothetical protein [Aquimarina aggregata]
MKEKELEWQPYKIGDVLVFQSDLDVLDTIWIKEISLYSNPKDNLSPLSDYNEILFVNGETSSSLKNSGANYKYEKFITLLKVTASDKSNIRLMLSKKNSTINYPEISLTIDNLIEIFENEPKINFFNISDVIEINGKDASGFVSDVKTIWWSKKLGYVKYNFKDNSYWEIKKFIRNGENLLEKQ